MSTAGIIEPESVWVPLNKLEPVIAKPYVVTCAELETIFEPFSICDEPDITPSSLSLFLIVVLIDDVNDSINPNLISLLEEYEFKLLVLVSIEFNLEFVLELNVFKLPVEVSTVDNLLLTDELKLYKLEVADSIEFNLPFALPVKLSIVLSLLSKLFV